ncbi:MAG: cytochrome ubiquinol oxidase subunit I, partial [Muribaculaceae bacterium]|nr:cytochrome ubiquinol oxidase subunit I [Muribaculaceae bacterium]
VQVAKHQPMKLAAMEGLYNGSVGQSLVAFGLVNEKEDRLSDEPDVKAEIAIPYGLSILANHDPNSFVPGINDLIDGIALTPEGDTIYTDSYAERIEMGRKAHNALAAYTAARKAGHALTMDSALTTLKANYKYFGYGFLDKPEDAVPPVAITFYSFRAMVGLGSFMLLVFVITLWVCYRRKKEMPANWICIIGMLGIPAAWVASQAGWIVAEVGRQPWVIQDILPTRGAISDIPSSNVELTFWIFAILFTLMLVAEISIMLRFINRASRDGIFKKH